MQSQDNAINALPETQRLGNCRVAFGWEADERPGKRRVAARCEASGETLYSIPVPQSEPQDHRALCELAERAATGAGIRRSHCSA